MKTIWLLLGLLTLTGAAANAQCHCVKLRLAIDDARPYRYRWSESGWLGALNVVRPGRLRGEQGQNGFRESFRRKAPRTGRDTTLYYDDRHYLLVPLNAFAAARARVVVTDVATRRKMVLRFRRWGFDDQYELLFDFEPGRHRIDLRPLRPLRVPGSVSTAGFDVTPVASSTGMIQWRKLRRK